MKKNIVYTDNSALYDIEQEIKSFLKEHKGKFGDDERGVLGVLLDRRAQAISDVLGVEVGAITSSIASK